LKAAYVAIDSVYTDPSNAMEHSEANLSAIKGSLARFGQQKPIVIDKNNVVRAGNGTLQAAKALGWGKIWVAKSNLEGSEMTAYALADNRTAQLANWNDEILGKTLQSLRELDFPLVDIGFDVSVLDEVYKDDGFFSHPIEVENKIFSEGDEVILDNEKPTELYSKKIQAPVYEPKLAAAPSVQSLFDRSKSDKLIKEIDKSSISEDVKAFLRLAAGRHNVFDYGLIAEFYAHASAEVQDLMEKSALVIIDFDKAIENGFIKLSSDLAEAYKTNEP
jgi:hypothetical protein